MFLLSCDIAVIYHKPYRKTPFPCHGVVIFYTRASSCLDMSLGDVVILSSGFTSLLIILYHIPTYNNVRRSITAMPIQNTFTLQRKYLSSHYIFLLQDCTYFNIANHYYFRILYNNNSWRCVHMLLCHVSTDTMFDDSEVCFHSPISSYRIGRYTK